ncbi:MAG TPA: inositol monophosphatase family protein [Verrucomicrobiae bacterium]|nr:inositol monophosphatase family protein [Verrucomicrobiae bacterium]
MRVLKTTHLKKALQTAISAAHEAGALMRKNLRLPKKINESHQHDIKLDLDVRCQKLIERTLRAAFPELPILGEEGILGEPLSGDRWVVDPIDGTVNFTYGIPHACVSIALQHRRKTARPHDHDDTACETVVGVVYDPFTEELFTAIRGEPAKLNGKAIAVSTHSLLEESIISIGFAKSPESLRVMLPQFNTLVHKVRKIRIMGAAALALVYVAAGRFDAYVEGGVRLWDIAAGGLILECAGGDFFHEPIGTDHTYRIVANNGKLRRKLQNIARGQAGK